MHSHILICGDIGVGKSTLISKLISRSTRHITGFYTKSSDRDINGNRDVYMYSAVNRESSMLIAKCYKEHVEVIPHSFDTFGVNLLKNISPNDLIVMDEIGFMECNSKLFTARILELLNGDVPIIASVKIAHKDIEFLNSVRNHQNADIYYIDKTNRDALYEHLKGDKRLL